MIHLNMYIQIDLLAHTLAAAKVLVTWNPTNDLA